MPQETFVERIGRELESIGRVMKRHKWLVIIIVVILAVGWITYPLWNSALSVWGNQIASPHPIVAMPAPPPPQGTTTTSADTSSHPCAVNVSNGAGAGIYGIELTAPQGDCLVSAVGSGTTFDTSNSTYKILPK